jgi:hypothetical protein
MPSTFNAQFWRKILGIAQCKAFATLVTASRPHFAQHVSHAGKRMRKGAKVFGLNAGRINQPNTLIEGGRSLKSALRQ